MTMNVKMSYVLLLFFVLHIRRTKKLFFIAFLFQQHEQVQYVAERFSKLLESVCS
jgi:hypothetical protein